MKDEEIIARARVMLANPVDKYPAIMEMLEQLADIADKRGAMLVEERARYLEMTSKLGRQKKMLDFPRKARHQLSIESSEWRRIGPTESEALRIGAELLDFPRYWEESYEKHAKVLRRLILDMED